MIITSIIRYSGKIYNPKCNVRYFYHWLNQTFNQLDPERLMKYGPDRVCAEWLLRNGAAIQCVGTTSYLQDYNALPPEETKFKIEKVNATDSSISHYGFIHFRNCKHIREVILHNCVYVEDLALKGLSYLKNTLEHVEISRCYNITDKGLLYLNDLSNLKTLKLYKFMEVKNKIQVLNDLKQHLPKCNIESDFETVNKSK